MTNPEGQFEAPLPPEASQNAAPPAAGAEEAVLYEFADGRVVVNDTAKTVVVDGQPVELQPGRFAVLSVLAQHTDRYISRSNLGEKLYPAEPNATARNRRTQVQLSKVREGLGHLGGAIVFVGGHGYRALPSLEGTGLD